MSAPVILSAEELAAIGERVEKGRVCFRGGRPGCNCWKCQYLADVPRLLAALAHMTKVADAERALRRAGENWRRAQGRHIEALTLRLPDEEQRGADSAQATLDLLAADRTLRALGVDP